MVTQGGTIIITGNIPKLNDTSTASGSTPSVGKVLPGQTLLKKTTPSGQVVTKVIVKQNPSVSKPQVMSTGYAVSGSTSDIILEAPAGGQVLSTAAGKSLIGPLSPTNTIKVSQTSLLSPTRTVTVQPTTPSKQIILNKVAFSPGKSPTKIAIPLNTQSPSKILQSGQFKIVSATTTTTSSAKKLTFSPQKVIIRQQPSGAVSFSY